MADLQPISHKLQQGQGKQDCKPDLHTHLQCSRHISSCILCTHSCQQSKKMQAYDLHMCGFAMSTCWSADHTLADLVQHNLPYKGKQAEGTLHYAWCRSCFSCSTIFGPTHPRQSVTNHLFDAFKFYRLQWGIEAFDLKFVELIVIQGTILK